MTADTDPFAGLDAELDAVIRRARARHPNPAMRQYFAFVHPFLSPSELADTHWLMSRFARQAEATAGIVNVWEHWLGHFRAGVVAQWAALRARVGRMPRRAGR